MTAISDVADHFAMIHRLIVLSLISFVGGTSFATDADQRRARVSSCAVNLESVLSVYEAIARIRRATEGQNDHWTSLFGLNLPRASFEKFFLVFVEAARDQALTHDQLYALKGGYGRETIRRYTFVAMADGWIIKDGRGEGARYRASSTLAETLLDYLVGPGSFASELRAVEDAIGNSRTIRPSAGR